MTAEIAILNRHGIALAADSAVTMGKERVWKTANKLFSLGPRHDIGIMMHGAGDYLGVPWEVIIKMFRAKERGGNFRTVAECADAFYNFVKSDAFREPMLERVSLAAHFLSILEDIKSDLSYQSKMEFRTEVCAALDRFKELFENEQCFMPNLTLRKFGDAWRDDLKRLAADTYGETITGRILSKIIATMHAATVHTVESELMTGIVIAGFGSDEIYPSLITYVVDGRDGDIYRCWQDQRRRRNLNEPRSARAAIIPFGQSDVVYTMMEGVAYEYITFIEDIMRGTLDEKSDDIIRRYVADPNEQIVERRLQEAEDQARVEQFTDAFRDYRNNFMVNPVIQVAASLPKEEMAEMARAMIEVTSLRRRMDSKLESVGGPVDVAVISKGDGFIWLRRKHYFNIDLNRDFLYRKHSSAHGVDQ